MRTTTTTTTMTSRTLRLQLALLSLVVFFLVWAVLAARPRSGAGGSAASAELATREQRLQTESLAVARLVERRWAAYRAALAARRQAAPPAPRVRVVTLPPLTTTRSS